jgi:proteasome assembly chaperone (PAC2) family protein
MMDDLLELWERPAAEEIYMIAGWRQWADAGSVSSQLPEYLVEHLGAREIGRIRNEGFYLFQLPGMHDLLRPQIKLEEGHRKALTVPRNQIYYARCGNKGLVIFLGDEPHLNADGYADAFFRIARELHVRRIAGVGGVYAPVPFEKGRDISCTYSLPNMKAELDKYAVSFSGYEGGATICSYFLDQAEKLSLQYLVFYAMVPFYDLSQVSSRLQPLSLEQDHKAWYDVMARLNHMFDLGLDLSDLRRRSDETIEAMAARFRKIERDVPQASLAEFREKLAEDFDEKAFAPLEDVWESELQDLFGDEEESQGS